MFVMARVAAVMAFVLLGSPFAGAMETLATVDGKPLTEKDLDGKSKNALTKARAEMYEATKNAVDQYLMDHLMDLEAQRRGKTRDQLEDSEIKAKTTKVRETEIKAFYEEFKKRGGGRGPVPPLAEVSGKIRDKLEGDRRRDRSMEYFTELKKKYKVAYALERPRMKVAVGDNPVKGPEKAPITIVEFSDFQCPFCQKASATVEQVLREYRGKVKLYFRDFPLGFHPRANPAAQAVRCATEQGKFWTYHDKLFENQKQLEDEDFANYARDLGMDAAKFDDCYKKGKYKGSVEKDAKDGGEVGVTGTPAFFINGIPLSGAVPFQHFKDIIDDELARVGTAGGSTQGSVMP